MPEKKPHKPKDFGPATPTVEPEPPQQKHFLNWQVLMWS